MSNASAIAGDNSALAFDVDRIRQDFPILAQEVYGKPLVYLDSGASAQKPQAVIDAMVAGMDTYYANVHRGVHAMSQRSTEAYDGARKKVATFLNARSDNEIVFTKNATEGINLVANSYARTYLKAGDEIIISHMEHHANIVPWQLLRDSLGIVLRVVPVDDDGNLDMAAYGDMLGPKTKLVGMTHVSNSLGTIVDIKKVITMAHDAGAKVLVDGCQAVPHSAVDVQDLDADFYVFAPHKLYGPTGIGVLYGKEDILNDMPPWQGGGDMIMSVSFEKTTYQKAPMRFEAGTPPIVEAIGLGAAIDYMSAIGMENIAAHEEGLLHYATDRLSKIKGLRIIGQAQEKAAIVSFVLDCAHPHDIGTIVDRGGVAIRTGHHCAQPVMDRFGVAATARASFGLYNTKGEVDVLADSIEAVREMFS
ncbi:MAG: cysteine desulfurase [Rhodospirillales bacterium]|jgi:cysteine desulfurase / selenocysteine lyase|nr:cysteine desulfurase [Rhodospirillales bacterium]MBT4038479.1 cysteine desulfurase [Rhodospirillales bacterium]MBT4625666.1 cysteine desulfurase [Rhodospirillales bacterium]MBT5351848.1 cysteine desulfurase [Rhodospirillales bacterium]MBT5520479.1 cysteine desulfurase [Rhodospirillales bacterium]